MNLQSHDLRIAIAQADFRVGAIEENADKIIRLATQAREDQQADVIVFPELTLTAYPPEDLLYREGLYRRIENMLPKIAEAARDIVLIVGYPLRRNGLVYNAAGVFLNGSLQASYCKYELPNYSVFDEKRYFTPGNEPCVITVRDVKLGITICEDIWHSKAALAAQEEGAQLLVNLNASPFHMGKGQERENVLLDRVSECGMPIVYVNMVGGQDELVFDGGSFVVDADGQVSARLPQFSEETRHVDFTMTDFGLRAKDSVCVDHLSEVESVYQALVLGVRDYIQKNKFGGAVIGLSGGIDSALTLAIAVDAVGAENVHAVSMPSRYTADMSIEDAKMQAETMGASFDVIAIEPMFNSFLDSLSSIFSDSKTDTTEENIQARVRGVLLMAISNKLGRMVLSTGNKSEVAVGYCTLYGDMVGGYSALKDVPKTLVYTLSEYRNGVSSVIPQRVLDRPPSAELAPDQKDSDSLPDYDVLDAILELYVEQDACLDEILAKGFDEAIVRRVIRLVNNNEYKRRQAAPGVRISRRAFGRDRRYPITSGF